MHTILLSIILFLPLLTGFVVLALPRGNRSLAARAALVGSSINLLLALFLYRGFDFGGADFQFVQRASWIPAIGAQYLVGVDGISIGLVLLTTFLTPIVIYYLSHRLPENGTSLLFTILALETSLLGVLVSTDVLLWYVFWEAMLIPMYFLIAVWGGQYRAYASLKFILYMMVGSLLMLVGILWFYWSYHAAGHPFTFDLSQWINLNADPRTQLPHAVQMWMFFFFFLSFAIKVPLFPFHTWLPDAQAEGPLAFNLLLVEVGAYAFIRFCLPLFPNASLSWAPLIMALAAISVIYGAVMAIVQQDLKRLFAYAGMSHGGFIMLGIFSMTKQGLEGAILYMINSGLTAGALFLIADLLYRRRGTRRISDFGGLAARMPHLYFVFMVVALGAIGLPGLNGFPSEFLVLLGAVRAGFPDPGVAQPIYGYLAGAGVVLSSVYMLWMFQRVMFGKAPDRLKDASDLQPDEKWSLWPFIAVIFFIGVGSAVFTQPMDPAISKTRLIMQGAAEVNHEVGPAPDVRPESPAQ